MISFLRRLLWRKRRTKVIPEVTLDPDRAAPVLRLAEVLAIFGEEAIEARALGTRGIFLPLSAAEEVARRLAFLSMIESRGYL